MKKDKAKRLYEEGCELYLQLFLEKHDFLRKGRPWHWAFNSPGTILVVDKDPIPMTDLRYDIDNEISEEEMEPWLDYNAQLIKLKLTPSSLEQWVNNTLEYTKTAIEYIQMLKAKAESAQLVLDKEISRLRNQ